MSFCGVLCPVSYAFLLSRVLGIRFRFASDVNTALHAAAGCWHAMNFGLPDSLEVVSTACTIGGRTGLKPLPSVCAKWHCGGVDVALCTSTWADTMVSCIQTLGSVSNGFIVLHFERFLLWEYIGQVFRLTCFERTITHHCSLSPHYCFLISSSPPPISHERNVLFRQASARTVVQLVAHHSLLPPAPLSSTLGLSRSREQRLRSHIVVPQTHTRSAWHRRLFGM